MVRSIKIVVFIVVRPIMVPLDFLLEWSETAFESSEEEKQQRFEEMQRRADEKSLQDLWETARRWGEEYRREHGLA